MQYSVLLSTERTSPQHYFHIYCRQDTKMSLQAVSVNLLWPLVFALTINVAQHSCCQTREQNTEEKNRYSYNYIGYEGENLILSRNKPVTVFCQEWSVDYDLSNQLQFELSLSIFYAVLQHTTPSLICCDPKAVVCKTHKKILWWKSQSEHNIEAKKPK